MGPSGHYRINTWEMFHAKINFNMTGEKLTSITMKLTQETQSIELTIADSDCSGAYLEAMQKPLEQGMTTAISSWGGPGIDMSWLDGGLCKENCDTTNRSTISNIAFTTAQKPGPTPTPPSPPSPGGYTFGNRCATQSSGQCGSNCD